MVSSVLVAEGQPARLLGLIDPTSASWEAMQQTRAFVVHVLAVGTGRWPSGSARSARPSTSRSSA
jgi:flavin reductase (DIM6/NTAB) family NADH-FMN oxidoreductase RutF